MGNLDTGTQADFIRARSEVVNDIVVGIFIEDKDINARTAVEGILTCAAEYRRTFCARLNHVGFGIAGNVYGF